MNPRTTLTVLAAGALLLAAGPRSAAVIGTFDCVTHDGNGTVWHFHSVNTAWGSDVRVDTVFPPQNHQPADYASTYVGYDEGSKQWKIDSVDKDGSHFTRASNSPAFNGSHWFDVDPADGTTATLRVTPRAYIFDTTTPSKTGKATTAHTVCTRE